VLTLVSNNLNNIKTSINGPQTHLGKKCLKEKILCRLFLLIHPVHWLHVIYSRAYVAPAWVERLWSSSVVRVSFSKASNHPAPPSEGGSSALVQLKTKHRKTLSMTSLLWPHYSLQWHHYSLLWPHYSLLWPHYYTTITSLLTNMTSLLHYYDLTTMPSLLWPHYSLLWPHYYDLITHYYDLTTHYYDLTRMTSLLTTMTSLLYHRTPGSFKMWHTHTLILSIINITVCIIPNNKMSQETFINRYLTKIHERGDWGVRAVWTLQRLRPCSWSSVTRLVQ